MRARPARPAGPVRSRPAAARPVRAAGPRARRRPARVPRPVGMPMRVPGGHTAQSSVGTAHKFKSFKYIFSPSSEPLVTRNWACAERLHRAQPSVLVQ